MNTFTWIFLLALATTTAARLWLGGRHLRFVQAHRDRVPDAFSEVISAEAHQKAAAYTSAKTRLAMADMVKDAALALLLTLGGGLQWLWSAWSGVLDSGLAQGIALLASVAAIGMAADLPFGAYRVFRIEARFGFNRMTPALYISDLAKQVVVSALLGLPLAALVLWFMASSGERWWLYAWVAWAAFSLLMVAVYPTYIAPLFNRFSPLPDGELKERVERLLERCGFRSQGLFVMDGSRRSSHGNAYFTGFGRGKRIVFFDTLLSRLSPPQVEAVLAHELGHFRLRHVMKRLALSLAGGFVMLWLLGYLAATDWFYAGLGVGTPGDALALCLFFIAVPAFTFPLAPIASAYSRRHEFEADQYAAQHADADELIGALIKLYQDNAATLTPDPLHSAVYDSHPPALARIARLRAPLHHSA